MVSLATVAFHYGLIVKPSAAEGGVFHAIHGRLCYIPIILGAIWFGVRGGLGIALFITALTIPYAKFGPHAEHGAAVGEYTEMIFYVAIGLTAGILIELQRRERRRREELAEKLTRQERLSSLGEMAAGLAHEIKNPLGSIKGSAEIISDDYQEGTKKRELVDVLSKETDRLNRVVEDFLKFARPRPIEKRPTQANSLVEDAVSQFEVDANAGHIRIKKKLDPTLPVAGLDSEKLRQVFLNMLINAANAMPDGGTIVVSTGRIDRGGRPHLLVAFEDEGVGIAPEDEKKIFDPFFSRSEKGTGLGLSISHTIVRDHGGNIEVKARRPRGTTISIVLPLKETS
jgi:signal transduction histidine kinase